MEPLAIVPTKVQEAIMGALGTQLELEAVSTVLEVKTNCELLENTIRNYVDGTTNHLVKLKRHLNSLSGINRLPIELFTHIIHLTNTTQMFEEKQPYVSYTWVCHHWRFILIHNPTFWTTIHVEEVRRPTPFVHEILRRTKSLKLEVKLFFDSESFIPMVQEFLAKASNRIQILRLESSRRHLVEQAFAGTHFPSLRKLSYYSPKTRFGGIQSLIPSIVLSDELEALDCDSWNNIPMDMIHQQTIVLSRIRILSIGVFNPENLQVVLDSLRENNKLHTLHIGMLDPSRLSDFVFSSQIILPELRVLCINDTCILDAIRVPKLSTLHIDYDTPITLNAPILKDFAFSSLKYLRILDREDEGICPGYSILGLKELISPMATSKNLTLDQVYVGVDFPSLDVLSDTSSHLPEYFCFTFNVKEVFDQAIKETLPLILPRLTGVVELCLSSPILVKDEEFQYDNILTHLPSLETLIVSYGRYDASGLVEVIRTLSNTSLCPRLKQLSYIASYSHIPQPEELEDLTKSVGKSLMECVQIRHKMYGDTLKCITLEQCPPLPDIWMKEIKKIGITVVTEKDIETVIANVQNSYDNSDEDSQMSGDSRMS